jgi:hypothetical protein
MKDKELNHITWQDVLSDHGIDKAISKSLIGFVSWNKDEAAPPLGKDITNVLSDSNGKAIAKDVGATQYNDRGLLFFDRDVPDEVANNIFDIIMEYEQEKVYKF